MSGLMPDEPALDYFAWSHLPVHLAEVSQPFCDLAIEIRRTLPENQQRAVALQKLLEAKDAAVRARLGK